MKPFSGMKVAALIALAVAVSVSAGSATAAVRVGVSVSSGPQRYGHDRVTVGIFYDELAPYGRWFDYGPHGRSWVPYDTPIGWRPYTRGYWAYTDLGWTWVSSEPWGWAAYHYGRWVFDARLGWVWVPGRVWAPAWVAWRYGDDWCGWAPLPPEARWEVSRGPGFGGFDFNRIEPARWCFVDRRALTSRDLRYRIVPEARGVTLFRRTRNVTRFEIENHRTAERGLRPEWLQHAGAGPVTRYKLEEFDSRGPGRGGVVTGGTLRMYRPRMEGTRGRPETPLMREARRPEGMPVGPRRVEAERRQLDAYMNHERSELERGHRQELSRIPPGRERQEYQARQQAEHRALGEQARRERGQVDERVQRQMEQRQQRGAQTQERRMEKQERRPGRGRGNPE
jgi:hypothetical protein